MIVGIICIVLVLIAALSDLSEAKANGKTLKEQHDWEQDFKRQYYQEKRDKFNEVANKAIAKAIRKVTE